MNQPAPNLGITALITTFCGYAYMLFGAVAGANFLWNMDISIKGYILPADWRIALLGIFGGLFVAAWGHAQDTARYQALSAQRRWIPWVAWTLVVFVGFSAIVAAVF
ncbi:MAG: hypothetical protein GY894_02075 [Planctomycetes bacterium]|nr:hypothetical protein [Planctomycetota bacterium]